GPGVDGEKGESPLEALRDDNGWTVNDDRVDAHRLQAWLSYLTSPPILSPTKWTDDETSTLTATITLANGTARSLSCAKDVLKTDQGVWQTHPFLCQRLAASPATLVGRPLLNSPISRIEVQYERENWVLVHHEDWSLERPRGQKVDSNQARLVALYLADLAPLSVPCGRAPAQFDTWATVKVGNDTNSQVLRLGKPDGRGVAAQVDDSPPVMLEQFQVASILLSLPDLVVD
ncbi:MAG: hypothetical protein HN348_16315, partial [Proteobacteria bacterium]|nr:hypothetical protein [Pseudomonadota bacterium]